MPETKTLQLKKETLEYGKKRLEDSPFQEWLKKNNLPDLTAKDLDDQYEKCMMGR